MKETSKATVRRLAEKDFNWKKIFKGKGLDVGAGDDPLPFENVTAHDLEQGDANVISQFYPEDTFDYVHASQCLEHMHDPRAAIREWLKVVKPKGYLVVTVPDWVMYEGMRWPAVYNRDHKSSWSMVYKGSIAPIHIHIPTFLEELKEEADTLLARFVDTNFDYKILSSVDQTFDFNKGVEVWNEFVLQKK